MTAEEAIAVVNETLMQVEGRWLSDVERLVFLCSWDGHSYKHMSGDGSAYSLNYLTRSVGPSLWRLLSRLTGNKVVKTNLRSSIEQLEQGSEAERPKAVSGVKCFVGISTDLSPKSLTYLQELEKKSSLLVNQELGYDLDCMYFCEERSLLWWVSFYPTVPQIGWTLSTPENGFSALGYNFIKIFKISMDSQKSFLRVDSALSKFSPEEKDYIYKKIDQFTVLITPVMLNDSQRQFSVLKTKEDQGYWTGSISCNTSGNRIADLSSSPTRLEVIEEAVEKLKEYGCEITTKELGAADHG